MGRGPLGRWNSEDLSRVIKVSVDGDQSCGHGETIQGRNKEW